MVNIVDVVITQQVAATPSTLQQTGCFVSQGATVLAPGASALVAQLSDLAGLIRGALNLANLTWSGGVASATTSAPHGFTIGDSIYLTMVGQTPVGYVGTFLCTITGASTYTYLVANPGGSASVPGSYSVEDIAELNAQVLTYFAQANPPATYVLELGAGNPNDGIASLAAYLTANPNTSYVPGASGFYYRYTLPRTWDGNANLIALIHRYQSTTAATYFMITTTLSTYGLYTDLDKEAFCLIEAPATAQYPSIALTSISWAGNLVTATTAQPHGISPGEWFQIQGCVPVGYNGYWQAQAATSGSTLTYNLATNPGVESTLGTLVASQVASAGIPVTEFSIAATTAAALRYRPSSSNKVSPFAYQFMTGVTAFPPQGNNSLLLQLKNAGVNIISSAAEGGIDANMVKFGTTMDMRGLTYWYSVDWFAINARIAAANVIINGSNNPLNPLYEDQNGINRLQDAVVATAQQAITVGLALSNAPIARASLSGPDFVAALNAGTYSGQIVINAVPFAAYYATNPGDFKIGEYDGLSVAYIPNNFFEHVLININVTDIVA
jgi:hypothetical protein